MFLRLLIRIPFLLMAAVMLLCVAYNVVPPISSVMLQSAVRGDGFARTWVPLRAISPSMQRAVLAGEDTRFCMHHGIDWRAAEKAMNSNMRRGRVAHGASTITMQVAKNLFLWNGRSWLRKTLEAPIALLIDLVMPKRRILEIYLNTAEWGKGVFGIEQASKRAFNKSAHSLTPSEAALLAAALPSPQKRNAVYPTAGQQQLATIIRTRMAATDTRCIR